MKAYCELQYNNTKVISEQVLNYLTDKTNILVDNPKVPWIFLDKKSVLESCTELFEFFKLYKLIPRDISVTVLHNNLDLHYDAPPVVAKINLPILNTENSVNRWYTISDDDYTTLPYINDPFNRKAEDISVLPRDRLTLFAEYYGMVNPIVFHSRIPHEVVLLENATLPRIVLSCTFHNEPLHYLE